ncbi:6588_t:CDS:2, partial [Funneliformis mosseae]
MTEGAVLGICLVSIPKPYWKGLIEKENLPVSPRFKRKRLGSKTEVEVLTSIPPPIYYSNLEKSWNTTNSSKHEPIFHQYEYMDDISNEEHVRQALSVNLFENLNSITALREPRENSRSENRMGLEQNPYPEKLSVVDILRQRFGYLVDNHSQYGILSTYNQNWFIKRPNDEPRTLEISPTIDIQSENPSILKCYAYIQHLSKTDTGCASPGLTPLSSPSYGHSSNDSSDNISLG